MDTHKNENSLIISIIKTLCYAQIFSYPLTLSEIHKYFIGKRKVTVSEIEGKIAASKHIFYEEDGFVVLSGDKKNISERRKRASNSRKKMAKAVKIARILSLIPTVKLIGVTGSVSMYNSKKDDDIDLFFITSRNSLWVSRFFVNIILLLLSEKRMYGDPFVADKICPNMFLSEEKLVIVKKNLYTAHEIVQMKVIISKENMYNKFLDANSWLFSYLPNSFKFEKKEASKVSSFHPLMLIEPFFYGFQKLYMAKKITHEEVSYDKALFHPSKIDKPILELYDLKVKFQTGMLVNKKKKDKIQEYIQLN